MTARPTDMPQPSCVPRPDSRKETIATRVASELRAEILGGEMAPAEKLNLDRLRQRLEVSLAPVREAMGRLVAEGLVEFEDQRGYRIAPVSQANLEEVTRLRQELEVMALDLSIERGDIDWESAVLAALHRLDRAQADRLAPREDAHAAFHAALASGAGMSILASLCARFGRLHDRYRMLLPPGAAALAEPPDEHAAIAEAAVVRDGERACSLLSAHIARTGATLAEGLAGHLKTT